MRLSKESLDRLASRIKLKQSPVCVRCGRPAKEVHHIFSRNNLSTRYYMPNLASMCRECHTAVHSSDRLFFQGLDAVKYEELRILANKVNEKSLEEWNEYLQSCI